MDLPRGSMAERREWSRRHPWLVGAYFFVVFATPLAVLGLLIGSTGLVALGVVLSALAGVWAVWAVKTDWRASPPLRRLLNGMTLGQLDRWDPPDQRQQ